MEAYLMASTWPIEKKNQTNTGSEWQANKLGTKILSETNSQVTLTKFHSFINHDKTNDKIIMIKIFSWALNRNFFFFFW